MPESPYAWARLFAALLLSAIGGIGTWSVIVVLPGGVQRRALRRGAALHGDDDLLRRATTSPSVPSGRDGHFRPAASCPLA